MPPPLLEITSSNDVFTPASALVPAAGTSYAARTYCEPQWVKVKVVGRGHFGAAVLLRNKDTGEVVVAKEINLETLKASELSKVTDEVDILARLSHWNIVCYRGSFKQEATAHDPATLKIIMEYASGGDLHGRIMQQRQAGKPFSTEQVVAWLAQLADALQYVHSCRVLHRDLKPQNVFLSATNTIKLGDFGISRELSSQTEEAKTFVGTPYYFSPELIKGDGYSRKLRRCSNPQAGW